MGTQLMMIRALESPAERTGTGHASKSVIPWAKLARFREALYAGTVWAVRHEGHRGRNVE